MIMDSTLEMLDAVAINTGGAGTQGIIIITYKSMVKTKAYIIG